MFKLQSFNFHTVPGSHKLYLEAFFYILSNKTVKIPFRLDEIYQDECFEFYRGCLLQELAFLLINYTYMIHLNNEIKAIYKNHVKIEEQLDIW